MSSNAREKPYSSSFHGQEDNWEQLRSSLHPQVIRYVHAMCITVWRGQENDLAEDIIQETITRAIERMRKAKQGRMVPIYSLKEMLTSIATNYCKDRRRHDKRLLRMDLGVGSLEVLPLRNTMVDCVEIAAEQIYREEIFKRAAQAIAKFPQKQRQAVLIDLANRMSFGTEPTLLQRAFSEAGIALKQYQQPLSEDLAERSRHISLLNHGYKRLALAMHAYNIDWDAT